MAEFEAKVQRLTIEEHPNADALELARIGNYRSVVRKGQFQSGDLAVYIPEQAILPDWLISELGLEGKLAGSKKNRVKATKLRGILSQGLVYPVQTTTMKDQRGDRVVNVLQDGPDSLSLIEVEEGEDVTDDLGIIKYEPPIPVHMSGDVFNAFGKTIKYDIENFKKYPNVIEEGEQVVFTEKIHGTWVCYGYHPDVGKIVCSKGLSFKGLAFKFNEKNQNNLYMRALEQTKDDEQNDVIDRLLNMYGDKTPIYLLGEVYGKGVQDLSYGTQTPHVRFFDLHFGDQNQVNENIHEFGYASVDLLNGVLYKLNVDSVPHLYRGPFSENVMEQFTNGYESVSGSQFNIREGIVIKPVHETYDAVLGREILKSVSEDYLLRRGGTEYN